MRILALDTATRNCSVAVVDDRSILAEETNADDKTHAVHVIEMIQRVIARSTLKLSQIDGFAVGRGPGSFTGLRIGIATVKALAVALEKPVVGISDLDALAAQAGPSTAWICALMDARKGEVYGSTYCNQNGTVQRVSAVRVATIDKVLEDVSVPCVFIGGGASLYREKIIERLGSRAVFVPPEQNIIRASTIGRLSLDRFQQMDGDDVSRLVPDYVRKSDAELGFKRKKMDVLR